MAAPQEIRFQILTEVTTPGGLDALKSIIQQLEDHINSGIVYGSDGNRYRFDGTTWVQV
jgi:hypothetical protein